MTIEEKKLKEAFRLGCYFSLGIVVISMPFIEPVRVAIVSPLERFVQANIELFIFLLNTVFVVSSVALIALIFLLQREYRRQKPSEESFRSQLVVKNYYAKGKVYDFTKAIATAISKYSRRDLGSPADTEGEVTADGPHQIFYSSGQLEKEFTYKKGKLDGLWRTFYSDGVLHQEKSYKDGILHGIFRAFDEQGILFFEVGYKDGRKHGIEKTFYPNGAVQYVDTFQEGKMVNRKTFDESGEMKFNHDYHVDEKKDR